MMGFCHGPQVTLELSAVQVSASASAGIADQRLHLCLLKTPGISKTVSGPIQQPSVSQIP